MKNFSKKDKTILTIFALAFIIWLGGAILRTAIGFTIFEPSATETLVRKASNDILMQTVYIFASTSIYTSIAYVIAFALSFFLLAKFKKIWKQQGWILMCFVLFYLFSPVELFTIYQDIKLSIAVFQQNVWEFYSQPIQDFFMKRVKNVVYNSLNGLTLLSYLTIVIYVIWQPLKKTTE
ncbi:MAG TPA: hypothetical protein PLC04_08285 [Candidatus Kapabacteria bacterium]|nr:hypothetical protein [Prolixibacteraceae bacterium]HOV93058.1 hypothetical protein [Candidatus Kapabacteria bacterium]